MGWLTFASPFSKRFLTCTCRRRNSTWNASKSYCSMYNDKMSMKLNTTSSRNLSDSKKRTDMALHYRLATKADYEGVVTINKNIFLGFDPLLVRYHQNIDDPDKYSFLAENDQGKMLGFIMLYIVDGGTGAIFEGARTHPDVRGQSVFRPLHEYALYNVLRERPGLKRRRITTWQPVSTLPQTHREYSVVFKGECDIFLNSKQPIDDFPSIPGQHVNSIDALKILISNKKFWPQLFPEDDERVTVVFEPYAIMESNFKVIVNKSETVVSLDKNHTLFAVSFSQRLQAVAGFRYDINFYGTDYQTLLAHLRAHYSHAKQVCPKHGTFLSIVNFQEHLDISPVLSFMKENYQLKRDGKINPSDYMYTFEADVPPLKWPYTVP